VHSSEKPEAQELNETGSASESIRVACSSPELPSSTCIDNLFFMSAAMAMHASSFDIALRNLPLMPSKGFLNMSDGIADK
jgi:hypothetical protein